MRLKNFDMGKGIHVRDILIVNDFKAIYLLEKIIKWKLLIMK